MHWNMLNDRSETQRNFATHFWRSIAVVVKRIQIIGLFLQGKGDSNLK